MGQLGSKPKVTREWVQDFLDNLPIVHSYITAKNEIHHEFEKEQWDFVIEKFKEIGLEVEE